MRNQVREQRTQREMSQAEGASLPLAFAIARFFDLTADKMFDPEEERHMMTFIRPRLRKSLGRRSRRGRTAPFVLFVCIVNVVAAVSIAVCWPAFTAVWLITANYNETRAPAQRQRSWYGTGAIPVLVISFAVRLAVPRADWHSVTFSAPWARFLGLAILLAATALTLWARFALGLMWSAVPRPKRPSAAYQRAVRHHQAPHLHRAARHAARHHAGGRSRAVDRAVPDCADPDRFKIRIEERFMTAEFPQDIRATAGVCRSWCLASACSPAIGRGRLNGTGPSESPRLRA